MDKLEFVKFMPKQGFRCELNERGLPTVWFKGSPQKAKSLKRIVKSSGYNASWGIVYAHAHD